MCSDGTFGIAAGLRGGGRLGAPGGPAPPGIVVTGDFAAAFGGLAVASGGAGVRAGCASGGPPGRGPTGGMLEKGGRFGEGTPRGGGGSAPIGRSVVLRAGGSPTSESVGITLRTRMGGPTTGGGSDGCGAAECPRGGGIDEVAPRSSVRVPLGTVLA
jgi:hypothetical protein